METLDSWKLNVTSFYPVGLKHHGSDKTAAVFVWSSNLLYMKKFRLFTNAIENNLPPDKDQIRNITDTISQIITNTSESVVLTESQTLKYFETHKILRNVDYVGRVKAICTSKEAFVILQLTDEGNIQIILHPDSFPCPPMHLRLFDVSFDKNCCQATWIDAHFNIAALHANPSRPEFFNSLRKCPGEQYTVDASFIFFSINNTLLSLVVDTDDYRYHLVHTHSSNVRGIHSSKDLNSIYVLLESGVIDVVHACHILGVIKTSSLCFMYDVGAYDICDDIFVYSDGFQVVIGHIEYSSATRTYKTSQKTIQLPGIVAFTTVKACSTVLCLSENRIFYKIPYSVDEFVGTKSDLNMVMMPVKEFLSKAESATIDIQQLVDYYDHIKSELSTQQKTFDALALRYNYKNDKSVLRFPLNAKLKLHRTIPDLPATAIYPKTRGMQSNGCFLHIQIQPHRFGKVFSTNMWSLSIHCETSSQTFSKVYRLINEDFAEPLDILLALEIKNHILPPHVNVKLSASVKIGQDVICISFPVHTDMMDYRDMIKLSNKIPHFQISTSHRNINVKPHPLKQQLTYSIILPRTISLHEILADIDSKSKIEYEDNQACYLSLFNSFLELSVDDTSTKICLKSRDAAVMLHVKKFIFERLLTTCNLSVDSVRTSGVQKYIVSRIQFLLFVICSAKCLIDQLAV